MKLKYFTRAYSLNNTKHACSILRLLQCEIKTMIVSMQQVTHSHPQSPVLTIGGTVLKESDDLVILGVTFDSKMPFRSIFTLFPEQLLNGLVS